jgi:hypothetical protein
MQTWASPEILKSQRPWVIQPIDYTWDILTGELLFYDFITWSIYALCHPPPPPQINTNIVPPSSLQTMPTLSYITWLLNTLTTIIQHSCSHFESRLSWHFLGISIFLCVLALILACPLSQLCHKYVHVTVMFRFVFRRYTVQFWYLDWEFPCFSSFSPGQCLDSIYWTTSSQIPIYSPFMITFLSHLALSNLSALK